MLREDAEGEARREERVRQYYRQRHARRHRLMPPELLSFEVDCRGDKHRVALNERGQLVLLDHLRRAAREVGGDEQSCLEVRRKWKEGDGQTLPQELGDELFKLQRRGRARRRRNQFRDPLPRSNADRIRFQRNSS